ncbi:prepilin-type N-terminal cleavage/methylation domain-containing protein [Clostridium sp. BL-8]|uniref:PulJ/GspJ family protein n=1 Tax=Clostridium sp. BL-8 TaxID=349938 RepID=UPI00098CB477|nr:prepilin-type N-terminal cleavage/methylation domain-containing protein [Clostridium sp. BL-8]OOM71675.1 hypothetical protein CLOBL_49170 [Clostridium sp. BL-8]
MKDNSKKKVGFTLIEVVISLAILSIISIGVYDGLMIIMKQTKAGQAKQAAALEGKKLIETMKANSFSIPNESSNGELIIGNDIKLQKKDDADNTFIRYLDESYSNKSANKYSETVTITPAQAWETQQTSEDVELDTNGTLNSESNKLYISKINSQVDSQDYVGYWNYDKDNKFVPTTTNSKPIPSDSKSLIEMSVYFTTDNLGNQNIAIKDYTGQDIFPTPIINTGKDLVINFSNYINDDGSIPTNEEIQLDIYNKTTSDVPKIYIEKPESLNVDVEARKGQINIYDNRSGNPEEDSVGTLYDIELQINDINNNNNLFTGYYKKNIN